MNLNGIKAYFLSYVPSNFDPKYECALLTKAMWYLKLTARAEAALWYSIPDASSLDQEKIQRYLMYHKEYDAAEISWIIKLYKENGCV